MPSPAAAGPPVIGIDLGATNMNLAVVDASDRILARTHQPTRAEGGPDDVLDRLAQAAIALATDAVGGLDAIGAVGIAVASPVDAARGIALHAMNLGWKNVPVGDHLRAALGRPVVVDNDVNGAVWGEYCLGAGRDAREMLGVWVGTGVGGGLVLDGSLYHGAGHTAGEIGQTISRPDGPPGARTVEELCSRNGLAREIARLLPEHPDSCLGAMRNDQGIVSAENLRDAWQQADALATQLIEQAARLLGVAIANTVTLLSLDLVVLGGGVSEVLGDPFLERVRASFVEAVFPEQCREVPIVLTALAADAGLLGAARLARAAIPTRA